MKTQLIAILATSLLAATGCDKPAEPEAQPVETAEVIADNAEGAATAEAKEEVAEPAEAEATVATVGQPAPDFELPDEKGTTHKLSDLKGKIVVLEWTNPDCPVVQRVYGSQTMQTAIKELGADVKWLAIDSSNFVKPEDSTKWAGENKVDWPQLQDPTGATGKAYGAKTTPHMFVVDAEGVLRYSGAIDNNPNGKLDAKDQKNYVVEAVKSLTAGTDVVDAETKPYGCSVKYGS